MSKFQEFWENGGRDIVTGVGFLILGSMIGKVEKKQTNLAKAVEHNFRIVDGNLERLFDFKEKSWDNFEILQRDINRLATHTGFQGTLGVNS